MNSECDEMSSALLRPTNNELMKADVANNREYIYVKYYASHQ
jgi:hypothetical protein